MALSSLTVIKFGVILLGLFNLTLIMLKGQTSPPSPSRPRRIHIQNDPQLELFHLAGTEETSPLRTLTLFTEETVRYPIKGPLADQDWASLVPEGNHGLVLLDPPSPGSAAPPRPYAIAMFHTLHCLDRIRRTIVYPPGSESESESDTDTMRMAGSAAAGRGTGPGTEEPPETAAHARFHVHHCLNYVRQMILCAANTRLNPINHVLPSGKPATDGIGLEFQCRDWNKVYDAFEANYALNRTMAYE